MHLEQGMLSGWGEKEKVVNHLVVLVTMLIIETKIKARAGLDAPRTGGQAPRLPGRSTATSSGAGDDDANHEDDGACVFVVVAADDPPLRALTLRIERSPIVFIVVL